MPQGFQYPVTMNHPVLKHRFNRLCSFAIVLIQQL